MSSYHSSFTYLNKNSSGEGFIIASFEPDSGFVDTYLGMDQIVTESYDGTKKHFYGNKYNSSAEILITLVKPDGSDFSMEDNRRVLRWLTGSRQAAWLDLYAGDKLVYSFYGSVTACQQQKLDARIVGIQITFSSIHPWAWSAPQHFNCIIGENAFIADDNGILSRSEEGLSFGITNDGVVYNDHNNESFNFNISSDGTIFNDGSVDLEIYNQSDDLYTLTNLDILYKNHNSSSLIIENRSLGKQTIITGIESGEVVTLSAGQFIISDKTAKIFGDNFNFVWPQLQPGINKLYINGSGKGSVEFSYRYPIKIGDCAINIDDLSVNPMCEGDISGVLESSDGITKLGRKNVILVDRITGIPYTASVKDSYLYLTESNDNRNRSIVFAESKTGALYEMTTSNTYLHLSDMVKNSAAAVRDSIVLIDEISNKPYELMVKDDNLYLSEIQTYGGERL